MKGGSPLRQPSSASSIRRASACRARAFSETAGHDRSSDRMLSTWIRTTIACMTFLLSAGITYQGAHNVEVAVIDARIVRCDPCRHRNWRLTKRTDVPYRASQPRSR